MLAAEAASQRTSMSHTEERKSSVLLEVRVKFIKAVSQDESCDTAGEEK